MSKSKVRRAAARPTPYEDLNLVLAELVEQARALLADNFVGAYLHGSFALGDFDDHSDLDMIIITERDVPTADVPALNVMHEAIFALPSPWAQHLECSYAPRAILRHWALEPRDPPGEPRPATWADPGTSGAPPRVYPFHFLGNGSRNLVRSEHDNTQVVRWTLREKGVVLAGPSPRELIDPVAPDAVRVEVRALLANLADRLAKEPDLLATYWIQGFMALLVARMLHTLASGRVNSKRAALAYARQTLEPRWSLLVERAWAQREDAPRGPDAPAAFAARRSDPTEAAETQAYAREAVTLESRLSAARSMLERRLAQVRHGPLGHASAGHNLANPRGPGRGGWSPPPIRPGGRGRRG
jgi:hypothetical protein